MLQYLLAIVLVLLVYLFTNRKRDPRLPPGVYGWPIVGVLPSSKVDHLVQVEEFRKQFGDIFMWRVGIQYNVYLSNPKIIRKAFNDPHLLNRPEKIFTLDSWSYFQKIGIFNSNGQNWQTHRKFILRHLKDSGFGKRDAEAIIHLQAETLIKNFKENLTDAAVQIPLMVTAASLSVIWHMTADIQFEEGDEDLQRMVEAAIQHFTLVQGPIMLFDVYPWLLPFTPKFVMDKMGFGRLQAVRQVVKDYIMTVLEKKKASLNRENPCGYIDHYLIEMEKDQNPQNQFNEKALITSLSELIIGGSDDVATTLRWGLQILACNPETQKKIQEEIDSVVPRDRMPAMDDKPRLPLTEATMCEVLRVALVSPVGFYHAASQDMMIEQYFIPKGTLVLPFIQRCHTDPKYWKNPNEFDPQNFLDSQGNFVSNNEAFMPFSTGRRSCLGENLARAELFLFLSALLQKFSLITVEDEEIPSAEKDPRSVIFNLAPKMKILVQERYK